ncbi:MAG TPA: formylglycine-generating enzyme family protein [Gemmatimonadaceae bacterium]
MMLAAKLALVLSGMSVIPQGTYSPLYAAKGAERVAVRAFALDREPVTRGDFLEFVKKNPAWRRSVIGTRADKGYLEDWKGDLAAGDAKDLRKPVTSVSRSAAYAYCTAKGKRLPTPDEWEYAAAASETKRDASRERSFISRLISFYTKRSASKIAAVGGSAPNVYGVRDMHELVWEWTADPHAAHKGHGDHMYCASSAIGAADPSNYPAFMRATVRSTLNDKTTLRTLGFRCAANA